MRSTRRASPLHMFVLASVLVVAGGVTRLNQTNPGAEQWARAVYQILPSQSEQEIAAQAEASAAKKAYAAAEALAMRESLAQRRARYAPHIQAASEKSGVAVAMIEAVITAESAFNPFAISRTGAVGLMQLMPDTAARFGVTDRTDPAQNIMGGAKYLFFLLNKFESPKLAIAAYNAGEGNVIKHGNKIPPFKETQKYVPKVLAFFKKYRKEDDA